MEQLAKNVYIEDKYMGVTLGVISQTPMFILKTNTWA